MMTLRKKHFQKKAGEDKVNLQQNSTLELKKECLIWLKVIYKEKVILKFHAPNNITHM